MPYGQKYRERCISIDINALRAKEETNFKLFVRLSIFFTELFIMLTKCTAKNIGICKTIIVNRRKMWLEIVFHGGHI